MPRVRTSMTDMREILRLRHERKLPQRKVARASGCSLGIVNKVLRGAARAGLSWPLDDGMSEEELQRLVLGEVPQAKADYRRESVDFAALYTEMQKHKNLTVRLVWEEYRAENPDGYCFSHFSHLYKRWRRRHDVTMARVHKAGEALFVDYAGTTVRVCSPGEEPWDAQVFIAVLGASSYFYAEASRGQTLECWVNSHVRALTFFGGAPASVVPDNLRSAVTAAHLYEPTINRTYREFAHHYGMAVLPARPGKPRDNLKDSLNPPSQLWRLAT